MPEGLNRVMLLGNLGADPELRVTRRGDAVLHLRLATTGSYIDSNGSRRARTEWHNVVLWGRRAEALEKRLHKGSSVFVEGSLRTSSYDDRDGNRRYRTEVVASNIILNGGRVHGARTHDEAGDGAPRERSGGDDGYFGDDNVQSSRGDGSPPQSEDVPGRRYGKPPTQEPPPDEFPQGGACGGYEDPPF